MNRKTWQLIQLLAAFALLLAIAIPVPAQAAPPAQDPFPAPGDQNPDTPDTVQNLTPVTQDPRPGDGGSGGGSGSGGGGNGGDSDGGSSSPGPVRCASLQGQVINWGVGGLGGVSPSLRTGSWEVTTTSADDGNYGFGGLGVGIARLQVAIPPALESSLTPLVQDVGVYLNCDYPVFANIALYSGSRIDPPATVNVTGPASLTSGESIPLKVAVRNELPNQITNVVVTSLLPANLAATNIEAASVAEENLQIINGGDDGQLVVAYLDTVASGAEVNIFISVTPAEGVSNGQANFTASLLYRESAADQDTLSLGIGEGTAPVPTVTPEVVEPAEITAAATVEPSVEAEPTTEPTSEPVAETVAPTAEPTAEAENEGEEFIPPNQMPTTGDSAFVPPDMLPTTGQDELMAPEMLPETGVNPILPISGLSLVIILLVAHSLRVASRRPNE